MTKSFIKSFSVYGLFGKDDVHIPFDENIKILIGENGVGKTQVLNIFYYTLTKNFFKLGELPFEKIKIEFNDELVIIERKKIIEFLNERKYFLKRKIITGRDFIADDLHEYEYEIELIEGKNSYITQKRKKRRPKNIELSPYLVDCSNIIDNNLNKKNILYFPTFRRVEEDLHNLGYDEEELSLNKEDTRLIHFGMDDVQKRFDTVEKRIDSLLKEGFTKISSEILSKLVKGFGDTNKKIIDKISETDIDIILARVGDQISDTEKSKIREIVLNKEVSNIDNSLFYFIQTLVEIYEKQKKLDESINRFKEVCNGYLISKQVFYDESNIKIYIKSDKSSEPLALNKLSSGEKQIISIFSKIYLSEDERQFIVLFDEPELSLSMPWQKKLLPDILASKKCDFLLAVTHSPFIFDNELDLYAMGLNEYIQSQNKVTA
ncbi:putative ATP/GTP-binding protein [Stanieria sp. NIES-3757]|nr:putative ATP/GTP-binding protein [Stanieria sp. NIES-3757]